MKERFSILILDTKIVPIFWLLRLSIVLFGKTITKPHNTLAFCVDTFRIVAIRAYHNCFRRILIGQWKVCLFQPRTQPWRRRQLEKIALKICRILLLLKLLPLQVPLLWSIYSQSCNRPYISTFRANYCGKTAAGGHFSGVHITDKLYCEMYGEQYYSRDICLFEREKHSLWLSATKEADLRSFYSPLSCRCKRLPWCMKIVARSDLQFSVLFRALFRKNLLSTPNERVPACFVHSSLSTALPKRPGSFYNTTSYSTRRGANEFCFWSPDSSINRYACSTAATTLSSSMELDHLS